MIREGRPVRLDGAVVEGDVDLDGVEYPHRLLLTNTVFRGHVHLNEARFAHTVDLSGCEFQRNLNLFAARVDGQLKLPRARILEGGRPVRHNFDQIEVRGRLNGTLLRSEVSLSFRQARLGEVGFDGIQIEGDLDFQIARVTGDFFCQSLEGARAEIQGCLRLGGLSVGGQVDLRGIRIGGDLNLSNAEIKRGLLISPDGGFRPEIQGGVFGTSAQISHILVIDRAAIGGDLDLRRIVVNGRMLCAFDEELHAVCPDVSGGEVPGHVEVGGRLDLSGAQVQELVLDGRLFESPGQPGPSENVRPRREFFRRMLSGRQEPGDEEPRLKLDRVRLSKLSIRHRLPDSLSADGMSFDDLDLPSCGGECEYTELLRRTRPFKRSTYLAVESWLNNKGLDESARRVYLQMSDRDLVTGHSSFLGRWLKWLFLGVTIGYGVRPKRLLSLFLVAFVLSCWVFSQPGSLVSYNERPAATPDPWPLEAQTPWVTLGVALRCHFPMLLFLGEPNYVPSPGIIPGLGLRYDAYALLISAISWVLVPLFLAGLTGIVRKKQ